MTLSDPPTSSMAPHGQKADRQGQRVRTEISGHLTHAETYGSWNKGLRLLRDLGNRPEKPCSVKHMTSVQLYETTLFIYFFFFSVWVTFVLITWANSFHYYFWADGAIRVEKYSRTGELLMSMASPNFFFRQYMQSSIFNMLSNSFS